MADLLNVELAEVKDEPTTLEKCCPGCYLSAPSELIKSVVRHRSGKELLQWSIVSNAGIVQESMVNIFVMTNVPTTMMLSSFQEYLSCISRVFLLGLDGLLRN